MESVRGETNEAMAPGRGRAGRGGMSETVAGNLILLPGGLTGPVPERPRVARHPHVTAC